MRLGGWNIPRWLDGLGWRPVRPIPDRLWLKVVNELPFLHALAPDELAHLRTLSAQFLARKEFTGAQGLQINDWMALTIAVQACLPLVHWGPKALRWYDDFVGIVVHPAAVVAQREVADEVGVVHRYQETLAGEAMQGGPVMLTWQQVAEAPHTMGSGHNLVIHEFAHKLDMRDKPRGEAANGCPPLPKGFMGLTARSAQQHWQDTLTRNFRHFAREVDMAHRFGAPLPWLDDYGAQSPAEFFAVACEAYFVNRERFGADFPELIALFDAFFRA
jgi:MtfA peptidase